MVMAAANAITHSIPNSPRSPPISPSTEKEDAVGAVAVVLTRE